MDNILNSILLVFIVTNIFLHSLGIHLLICLERTPTSRWHEMYLLNLSLSELLINISELLVWRIPKIFTWNQSSLPHLHKVQEFISLINASFIAINYYFSMFYITIDRLLDIHLNIRYNVYWNENKAKKLIYATWGFSSVVCICLVSTYFSKAYDYKYAMLHFFMLPADFLFIFLTIITYVVIFKTFRRTRVFSVTASTTYATPTCWQVFRNSRFYVSVLIILSFVLFMIFPDITFMFCAFNKKGDVGLALLRDITCVIYQIAYLSDAVIYIFMHQPVRKLLWKKIRSRRIAFRRFFNFKRRHIGDKDIVYVEKDICIDGDTTESKW